MSAAHHHSTSRSTAADLRLGDIASKAFSTALLVGAIAVGASLAIAAFTADNEHAGWNRFYRSYLMAFMFVLSLCLGALFFVMLQHAVKAGWSVVIRRLAEGVASNLTWIWILFLPILIPVMLDATHLYHWMHPGGDEVLQNKAAYFFFSNPMHIDDAGNWVQSVHVPWFWLLRAVAFFAIWAILAKFFVGTSIAQDASGDINLTRRMEKFAPLGLLLFGVSQSFAAIDWMMSLSPHWFSTMFPVYFFAASCCGYFALQILMMFFVQRNNRVRSEITPEHYQDAGKLLFAFGVVFWAYIAFSQYMLIWYANLSEETPWYLTRQIGGWVALTLLLLIGHFLGPFLVLISRHPKRMKAMLAGAAMWMLFVHLVDVYWLVMPEVPRAMHYIGAYEHIENDYRVLAGAVADSNGPDAATIQALPEYKPGDLDIGYGFHLLDVTCVIGLAGLFVAGTARRLGGCALIPERDPRLHESLAFENM